MISPPALRLCGVNLDKWVVVLAQEIQPIFRALRILGSMTYE